MLPYKIMNYVIESVHIIRRCSYQGCMWMLMKSEQSFNPLHWRIIVPYGGPSIDQVESIIFIFWWW
jgi:hypothetical protein